ncbi:hypothetical protein IQ07DRAFT_166778 [Pyrenochaeta sp. DS3sAY3a]|nr:hypothetical protein IQ07DRAFT_166778 [Pyrenochaeta sp. DS3sAY3a]
MNKNAQTNTSPRLNRKFDPWIPKIHQTAYPPISTSQGQKQPKSSTPRLHPSHPALTYMNPVYTPSPAHKTPKIDAYPYTQLQYQPSRTKPSAFRPWMYMDHSKMAMTSHIP